MLRKRVDINILQQIYTDLFAQIDMDKTRMEYGILFP